MPEETLRGKGGVAIAPRGQARSEWGMELRVEKDGRAANVKDKRG
jgi:hypothetical protein